MPVLCVQSPALTRFLSYLPTSTVCLCAFPKTVCIPSTFVHNNVFYWYEFLFLFLTASLPEFVLSCLSTFGRSLDVENVFRGVWGDYSALPGVNGVATCLSNLRRHVLYKLEFLYCLSYVLKHCFEHIKFCAILMKSILFRNNWSHFNFEGNVLGDGQMGRNEKCYACLWFFSLKVRFVSRCQCCRLSIQWNYVWKSIREDFLRSVFCGGLLHVTWM